MKEYIRLLLELLTMTKTLSSWRFVAIVFLVFWISTLWLAPDAIEALSPLIK